MRFKQFAGTALMPLLARLVLAAAFVTVGFNKIFTFTTIDDAKQLQSLRDLGVGLSPVEADGDAAEVSAEATWSVRLASFQPADQPAGDAEPAPAPAPAAGDDAADEVTAPATPDDAEPLPAAARVRSLHRITLMLDAAASGDEPRLPAFAGSYAGWLAWIAALTEFLGGVMLLLGMLSRVWGLGLAIAMGTAFWLTTVPAFAGLEASGAISSTLAFAASLGDYNRAVAQMALFVLALGIVLTGAGPLSVDAILFASDPHKGAARPGATRPSGAGGAEISQAMRSGVPAGAAAMTPGSMAAPIGAAEGTAYPPTPASPPAPASPPPASSSLPSGVIPPPSSEIPLQTPPDRQPPAGG
ncbi:MAG: DoxX family protein [Planctomycetota bacterium]|jgi:uncharacterized membrane protein YphA (DoxX/SURF4 family)